MIDRQLFRQTSQTEVARDLGPQYSLTLKLPKSTYGFPYTGLLRWEGDNSKLILYFATAVVTITGDSLIDRYGKILADQRLGLLIAPLRTDRFNVTNEGSEGVERIQVDPVR